MEQSGRFDQVMHNRIGSPYVIEAMQQMLSTGKHRVAGYEANGGFLISDRISIGDSLLDTLPTRDAIIVILAILLLSRERNKPISQLLDLLPARFTASNRLRNFPTESSHKLLHQLLPDTNSSFSMIEDLLGSQFRSVRAVNQTDGLRITFDSG